MLWNRSKISEEKASRDLLLSTARYVIFSTIGIYLLFHFVASLFFPRIFSPDLWICTLLMLATFLLTMWLLEKIYLVSQIIWLIGVSCTILGAFIIFNKPEILLLFCLLPLMATVTLGIQGTILVEIVLVGVIILLPYLPGLPPISSGYILALIFGFLFAGVFGWGISSTMLSALEDSSFHYYEARRRLQETREHRAEISRMLKEQSQSNYQLKQMNRMLEQARGRAEEAREDRDRFAMAVSHELRSPLNFIIGFSDLMVNAPETYAETKNWPLGLYDDVQEIYKSSKHLLGLINDILDLGKMDARRMPIFRERVKPQTILDEISELVSTQIRQKGLEFCLVCEEQLPFIYVDRTRIRQVLLNIITNSMRFTKEGKIEIQVQIKTPEEIEFIIQDTGPGIAKEDLEKIFEEFRQVGQENWSREKSTGLGLSISKRFVELHGGTMVVESEPGMGTTIRITLPLMEPFQSILDQRDDLGEGGEQRVASLQARSQSDVVIFCTTDKIQGKMVGQSLVEHEVVVAESFDQLKTLVSSIFPAAIIIDEAIFQQGNVQEYLKTLPYHLPVISFLFAGIPNRSVSLPFGVFRYLVKPVSRERLINTVQAIGKDVQNLLLVDDDPTMVRLFTQAIKSAQQNGQFLGNINFIPVYSGTEAIRVLESQAVDAVLLDLDLPDIHGIQVLAEIKKNPQLDLIPVIIISASDISEDFQVNQSASLKIFINRPFERNELSTLLQDTIKELKPHYQEPRAKSII
ncbi:MAG: hypothetical protein CVU39_23655 [Chloroflexi bacterium HGW-Chloroflexi-10]|nr:MAG: hypothetical protein CVU39_23655 [Chloroflexi bacterium HGW-Chloroflexi-10]